MGQLYYIIAFNYFWYSIEFMIDYIFSSSTYKYIKRGKSKNISCLYFGKTMYKIIFVVIGRHFIVKVFHKLTDMLMHHTSNFECPLINITREKKCFPFQNSNNKLILTFQ